MSEQQTINIDDILGYSEIIETIRVTSAGEIVLGGIVRKYDSNGVLKSEHFRENIKAYME